MVVLRKNFINWKIVLNISNMHIQICIYRIWRVTNIENNLKKSFLVSFWLQNSECLFMCELNKLYWNDTLLWKVSFIKYWVQNLGYQYCFFSDVTRRYYRPVYNFIVKVYSPLDRCENVFMKMTNIYTMTTQVC